MVLLGQVQLWHWNTLVSTGVAFNIFVFLIKLPQHIFCKIWSNYHWIAQLLYQGNTSNVKDLLFGIVERVLVGQYTTCDKNIVHIYNMTDTSLERMTIKLRMISATSYYPKLLGGRPKKLKLCTRWLLENIQEPAKMTYHIGDTPWATNGRTCSMYTSSSR